MKIRTDFVSNSSSSSFIVEDVERFISETKDIFDVAPYEVEYFFRDICISIGFDKSDRVDIEKFIGRKFENSVFEYPTYEVSVYINELIDLLESKLSHKIKCIEFIANSCDQMGIIGISFLKMICDLRDVHCSVDRSENSLMFDLKNNDFDKDNIIGRMVSVLIKTLKDVANV